MKNPRLPARATLARVFPVLTASILTVAAPHLSAATFTWLDTNSGLFNWNAGAWNPTAPTASDSAVTTDLIFTGVGTTQWSANNNLANPFLLNTLTLNSTATVTETITGSGLSFNANDTPAAITQSGSGAFAIGNNIIATNALTLNGAGAGEVTLSGAVSGSALTVSSGNYALSNAANSFNGLIVTGGVLEVKAGAGAIDLPAVGTNSYLGSGTITINGGELKLTTTGTSATTVIGATTLARVVNFGTAAGTLNLNGMDNTAGFNINLAGAGAVGTAVIKFAGGAQGVNGGFAQAATTWNDDANAIRLATLTGQNANARLRIELTNGAELALTAGLSGTITAPLTLSGVPGGNPAATGTEKTTGRVSLLAGPYTFTNGLFLSNALQFQCGNGTRILNGNITLNPGANVDFQGRGTGTAIAFPEANALQLGTAATINVSTLTISSGATASPDIRFRTDQNFAHGVQLYDKTNILAGGTLKFTQSWTSTTATNFVGWIDVQGDIVGNGTTASDSVINLLLPAADTVNFSTVNGVTFNNPGATGADLIVNGTGFGGLKVISSGRIIRTNIAPTAATYLYGATGATDPVANDVKVSNLLTPERLAALTGSGGYLTPAPTDVVWNFPVGGEWATNNVGLKTVNSNAGGTDVSLEGLSTWGKNLAVDAGATLETGAALSMTGGTLAGTGTVISTGGVLTIASGAKVAPGFSVGTLTVGDITINGTLQSEVTNAPTADLLVVGGNLTLGGTSTLSLPGGNSYAPADYTLATYSGALTGVFGTVSGLPANFAVDYGTGLNSAIKLLFTTPTDVWNGNLNGDWNTTTGNWKGGAIFADFHKVLIDDTASGPNTDIVINGGNVSPFKITVNNGAVYPNYSITGSVGNAIIGIGSLTKEGTGTLTLSGPHTYNGGTNVNNGTLKLGASNSLPDVGPVVVAASGVLDVNGMTDTIGTLSVDGSVLAGNLTTTGAVTLGDGASVAANLTLGGDVTKNGTTGATVSGSINLNDTRTFTVALGTSPELTLSGAVSNGSLTKSGDGTLVLNNGGNNYAGGTTVNAGTLKVGVAGALPAGTALTMNAGALDGSDTAISLSSLSGAAGATLILGSGSLAIAQTGNTTFAGDITGSASVTKTLGGRLTLNGTASDYSGGLFVNGGAVIAASFSGPGFGTVTVNPGGTFQAGAGLGNAIVLQGGTLATTLPGTTQLTFGDVTAATGTTSTIRLSDAANFATAGEAILGGTLLGSGDLTVLSNQINADGGVAFRLRGGAPSDYSGTITVGNSVKFELQSSVSGDFSPMGTGKVILTAGTTNTPGSLQGTYSQFQTRTNVTGTTTYGNNLEITGAGAVNYNGLGFGGSIAIMGDLKIGAGQSMFFNKNDAATDRTVAFQSVTLTGGTATFSVYDRNFRDNANAFVGPNVELGDIGESTPGSGVIFKSQGGDTAVAPFPHVTITGTSSYTGTTTVAVGTLQVGAGGTTGTLGSGDVIDSGLLLFNRSDTLVVPNDISGTGAVTNAGDPANVLDLTGAQDYATLNANSGTTHVHGSFTAGTAAVNVNATLSFGASQTISVLNIAAGGVVTLDGALPFGPAGAGDDGGIPSLSDSASGISENVLQAVPEPGTWSLLVCGALGLLARRKGSRA